MKKNKFLSFRQRTPDNHTQFQTKMFKIYTCFQTKMAIKPYPLGGTYLYTSYRGVPPPPPPPPGTVPSEMLQTAVQVFLVGKGLIEKCKWEHFFPSPSFILHPDSHSLVHYFHSPQTWKLFSRILSARSSKIHLHCWVLRRGPTNF